MIAQQALVHEYLETQPVKRAYLFGSQARGEVTPESDVDILVELEKSVSPYIRPYIEREKILIYEKTY